VCNFPTTVFVYLPIQIIETAIIMKILVPDRREGRNFFIDFHIRP